MVQSAIIEAGVQTRYLDRDKKSNDDEERKVGGEEDDETAAAASPLKKE